MVSQGTWEEAPDEQPETTEKLVVGEGEVKEVPADFVQAMNQPTEEQNPKSKVAPEHEGIVGQDFFTPQDEWKATVLGQFPTGEHLQVMKRANGSMYYLAFREGLKSVPKEIQGNYTNYDKAEVAGRNYLNKLWEQQGAETASS